MKLFVVVLLLFTFSTSFSQTKEDYVKYIGTRVKLHAETGKFISFKLVGTHLIYRYNMSLTSPNYSQNWVQEIDLDMSKVEDVVTIEENGYFWPTIIFSGQHAVFYDLDDNGKRAKTVALEKYGWGFSKEESAKIELYLKKLARLCGSKLNAL